MSGYNTVTGYFGDIFTAERSPSFIWRRWEVVARWAHGARTVGFFWFKRNAQSVANNLNEAAKFFGWDMREGRSQNLTPLNIGSGPMICTTATLTDFPMTVLKQQESK